MRRSVHATAVSFLAVSLLSSAAALAQPAPLTLPQASPKSSISQMVGLTEIAITYHRQLRNKRMTKSALDDIPGLGPVRKKRLIKELGGVNAVKRASLEDLTALAWLPDPVAHAIYEQLHAPPAKGASGASRVAAALAHLRATDD